MLKHLSKFILSFLSHETSTGFGRLSVLPSLLAKELKAGIEPHFKLFRVCESSHYLWFVILSISVRCLNVLLLFKYKISIAYSGSKILSSFKILNYLAMCAFFKPVFKF